MKLGTVNFLTNDNNILVDVYIDVFFGAATVEEAPIIINSCFVARIWLRNITRKMFSALNSYDMFEHSI